MFTGPEIVDELASLGITHVVWLPDSLLGAWEPAFESSSALRLVRVCREGEAWPLAAGLMMGGESPVVMMQTTGLFESGDALRNVLFDLQLPIFAIIGARSWLVPDAADSAKTYTLPILEAWGIDYRIIATAHEKPLLAAHYRDCHQHQRPGAVLIAEGSTR
jgi:sulfopyruvate decarboxylase TPP-binding subunit